MVDVKLARLTLEFHDAHQGKEAFMPEFVVVEHHDDIAVLRLNRPKVLNAWHAPMRDEIISLMAELDADPATRAIIMTGTGERAFGAGQDLNESATFDADRTQSWMEEWKNLYNSMRKCLTPTVAALNGVCVGSAFQVALMADFRVAHAEVRLGQPEINSGVASTVGPWIMREFAGFQVARDLTLTGRLIFAEEAHRLGFVDEVVERDQVMPAAFAKARELADKPPTIMRLNKQRLIEMTETGFLDAIAAGQRTQHAAFESGETVSVSSAFLKKSANR